MNTIQRTKQSYSESGRLGYLASIQGQQKSKQKRIDEYNSNPKKCIYCESIISYEKRHLKFCNHTCSATYNNKNNFKHGKFAIKSCPVCNKDTKYTYCSIICRKESNKKKRIEKLLNGFSYTDSSCPGNKYLKQTLIDIRGYKCESCNYTEWLNKPIVLTVEHKDGDATNNKLENLQLLCWNCHSMTPTFGRKNKKSSRKNRYKSIDK